MKCGWCKVEMESTKHRCGSHPYVKCPICGHIEVEMTVEEANQYNKDYRKLCSKKGRGKNDLTEDGNHLNIEGYTNARKPLLEKRLALIEPFLKDTDSIFDVGCGGGYMLDVFKKRGQEVCGIEIDPLCIEMMIELGIDCLYGSIDLMNIDKMFDVVMSWHSMEHVKYAYSFFKKCVEASKRLVICEVPYKRGFAGKFNGHVHYFCKESLEALVKQFPLKTLYLGEGVQKPALLYIGELE